jgi:hypothetical protein
MKRRPKDVNFTPLQQIGERRDADVTIDADITTIDRDAA